METKVYIDPKDYLHDIWRLGRQIFDSPWRPDILIALWRGGAIPGVAVHEFLKVKGLALPHKPVKCSSYTGIETSETTVTFDEHAAQVFASLKPGTKVLVVDDVFDTGRTAAAIHARMADIGCDMRFACVYWKPEKNATSFTPDFFVKKLNQWIVYPHEIEGLTPEEVALKDPFLAELLKD